MTLDALVMLAGAFVAVLPFLGLPNSWDTVLLFLVGMALVGLGIVLRRRLGSTLKRSSGEAFVENTPREGTHDPL
ncbi:hypothetical protein HYW60_03385 [Candidatus Kaiserbacteria bacterium]|nr:hypothetical protein [Candidatus Kaiserbacteria bacterium]